jgi:membrane protein
MSPPASSQKATTYRKILHFLGEGIWHVELSDLTRIHQMLLGLLQFIMITLRRFVTDRGLMMASALTFSTLLALIPLLALVFTFFSLLGGADWVDSNIRPLIFNLLATGSGEKLAQSLSDFVRNARVGTIGTLGFFFMIVTALALLNTIEGAFNQVWSVGESRSLLKKLRDYWSAVSIAPILIIVSLFLTTSLGKIPLIQTILAQPMVDHLLTSVMPLLLQWVAFYLFFVMIPNTVVRASSAALGALVGSVLWEIAKAGYLNYTANAVKYNLIYGSLAFIPVFMIWIYLTWVAVLIGVEVSYVSQNFSTIRLQKRRIRLSYSQKELAGLTVMVEVARRFLQGEDPTTVFELSHRLKLPSEHLRVVVRQLRERRLLGDGDDDFPLIITQDLDRISVQSMVTALRDGGGSELLLDDDSLYHAVEKVIGKLNDPNRKLLGETTLRQLVNDIECSQTWGNGKA